MKGEYESSKNYGTRVTTAQVRGISTECHGVIRPDDPDFPAAKAALDELVESEQEEWVEWETFEGSQQTRYRALADGSFSQEWRFGEWCVPHTSQLPAYRAGLEQGKKMAALSCETSKVPESDTKDASDDSGWVEVLTPTGATYRFTPEGECKQSRYTDGASWHNDSWPAADCVAKAFLQVRDEAVRELARAAKAVHMVRDGSDDTVYEVDVDWYEAVYEAARRVTL